MSKYESLYADIYSIFATPAWKVEDIVTIPENFTGSEIGSEFIRINIITSGLNVVNIPKSSSGQLIIDIFASAGIGLSRTTEIADKLDSYLAGRSIKTTSNGLTQFGSSTLTSNGNDKANPSLYRSTYSISFNYYGS